MRSLPLSFRHNDELQEAFRRVRLRVHLTPSMQVRFASHLVSEKTKKSAQTAQASTHVQREPIDNEAVLLDFTKLVNGILRSEKIPSEENCLKVLRKYNSAAKQILAAAGIQLTSDDPAPNSDAILNAIKSNGEVSNTIDRTALLALNFLKHPPVFITPTMLDSYVRTQSLLQHPYPFPEAFDLYAYKDTPVPDSRPVRYRKPNPSKVSAAIPIPLANMAVDTAIRCKDMQLSLDIITASFRTVASRRSKVLLRASPLIIGLGLTPLGAYIIASKFAKYQITVEYEAAMGAIFACIMAYVVTTSSLGLIAIATYNDQMERVTWQDGTPLRHRWLREEERAAVDRIALGFGYKDKLRRGEETGKDWEMLKEWAGMKSMIVDRVSLMEGME